MKRFIVAPDAAQDLDDIWGYIAEDSLDAADRFLEKLYENIRMLAETPGMGHARKDLVGQRPLPFWPVSDYLILYRAIRKRIEIVAVVHGKRDIPAFIRRREEPSS